MTPQAKQELAFFFAKWMPRLPKHEWKEFQEDLIFLGLTFVRSGLEEAAQVKLSTSAGSTER